MVGDDELIGGKRPLLGDAAVGGQPQHAALACRDEQPPIEPHGVGDRDRPRIGRAVDDGDVLALRVLRERGEVGAQERVGAVAQAVERRAAAERGPQPSAGGVAQEGPDAGGGEAAVGRGVDGGELDERLEEREPLGRFTRPRAARAPRASRPGARPARARGSCAACTPPSARSAARSTAMPSRSSGSGQATSIAAR